MRKVGIVAVVVASTALILVLTGCGKPWDLEEGAPVVAPVVPVPAGAGSGPGSESGSESGQGAGEPLQPKPSASPSVVAEDAFFAAKLGLKLVSPGVDPELPCRSGSEKCSGLDVTAQYTSDEISLREMLPFERAWFFIWSENAFPVPIRDAYFEHRIQDPKNAFTGVPDRIPVSFDTVSRVWFIPGSKLGRAMDHNPAFQQWLKLDLLLADGKRLGITIRFRALGAIPVISATSIPVAPPQDMLQFVGKTGSWTLAQEELRNPANRPLRVWIKAGAADIQAAVLLTFLRYHDRRNAVPTGPHPEHYRATARLAPTRLLVHRASGTTTIHLPAGEQRLSIELAPKERVRLEWIATAGGSQRCVLPNSATRTARWTTTTPIKCSRGECFGGYDNDHSAYVTETWAFSGAAVLGSWSREIGISNPFATAEDPLQMQHVVVASGRISVAAALGMNPAGHSAFSCQGIF